MRLLVSFVALSLALTACGKKEKEAAPAPEPAPKVSVDSGASAPAGTPPPPPVAAAPVEAAPGTPAPTDPNEGNWFARKTVMEKREIMEGWLHQYQTAPPDSKKEILSQIAAVKLTAADRTLLEALRAQFKYPPMPLK